MPSRAYGWGYNGELHEPNTRWQILGNGYRVYSLVLMRFHSADDLGPFDEGGINTYAYCAGDPVNRVDPSGHFAQYLAFGALGLAVTSGVAAAASHFSGDETARSVFGALALGSLTVAAMASLAHVVPKTLAPRAHGQQPRSRGPGLEGVDFRFFKVKRGEYVAQAHGTPGRVQLNGAAVGPEALGQRIVDAAGAARIKRIQLQVCHGATPGTASTRYATPVGQGVADHLHAAGHVDVRVTAFKGVVSDVGRRKTYKHGHQYVFLPRQTAPNTLPGGGGSAGAPGASIASRSGRELRRGR